MNVLQSKTIKPKPEHTNHCHYGLNCFEFSDIKNKIIYS